ncbi:MAG: PKD domain-containing protein [Armatimonadetes bacterium]|nr:PKD domain-containing protein [Armatimonadota bacterium]
MRTVFILLAFACLAAVGRADTPLTVSAQARPQEGAPPLKVAFSAKALGGKGNYAYRWDFGDGKSSTQPNPVHTYSRIGNFPVSVEVRSGSEKAAWTHPVAVALNETITVGPEGGAGTVRFQAAAGQKVRIRLVGEPAMEPYGYLESASEAEYRPPNGAARNGCNQWDGMLRDSGEYVLTVFDGTNQGG